MLNVQEIQNLFNKHSENFFIDNYTYSDVYQRASQVANNLKQAGLKPRERVIVQLWNNIDFVVTYFGILLADGVAVTISPMLTEFETDYTQKHSQARYIINQENLSNIYNSNINLLDITKNIPVPNDLAVIIYTSGTTNAPKGVMITYRNIYAQVLAAEKAMSLTPEDSFAGILSLSHVFGQMDMLWAGLYIGYRIYLLDKFSPQEAVDLLYSKNTSLLAGVPTMYQAMFNIITQDKIKYSPDKLTNLRVMHSGAVPLPVTLYNDMQDYFDVVVQEGYGLSETCSMAFSNPYNKTKAGSVGKHIHNVQFRLYDDENNTVITEPDIPGEIQFRGDVITEGYLDNAEATAEAFTSDGWFCTGDIGHIDSDNYLYITDRKKNIIFRQGNKVFPREIEEIILEDNNILSCAVVQKKNTNRLYSYIVSKNTNITDQDKESIIDNLKNTCSIKLAKYKRPNKYIFLDKMPQTPSGKVLKRELEVL